MKKLPAFIQDNRVMLEDIESLARKKKVKLYLVGGVLRDLILGKARDNPDFDFCLNKGAINFARQAARGLKAGFVILDEQHGCARVVKRSKNKVITLDFSDFRGKTLEEDLLYRDFTVNSLAAGLREFLKDGLEAALIDPFGSRKDLRRGLIRLTNKKSFDEDPLRIMRAFSLSAVFDFRIDPEVYRQIGLKKNKLKSVSNERIRDELFKILASSRAYRIIRDLDKYGVLELIFPELAGLKKSAKTGYNRLGVWKHTLLTLKNIEQLIGVYCRDKPVALYMGQDISSSRTRAQLLKLAALLHDAGKPRTFRVVKRKVQFHGHERLGSVMAGNISARLRLSNEETRLLRKVVFMHLRPGYLVTNRQLTAKAKFRFFRDADSEAAGILILALADERSTQGYLLLDNIRGKYERLIPRLIKLYFAEDDERSLPRLVDGNDIMKRFGLEPSPLIGKLLRELDELRAIGKISSKEEALKAAGGLLKKI